MWNYRICKRTDPKTQSIYYAIHEAFYNKDGSIFALSQDPIEPMGETVNELTSDLNYMMLALSKEVLDYDNMKYAKPDWEKDYSESNNPHRTKKKSRSEQNIKNNVR